MALVTGFWVRSTQEEKSMLENVNKIGLEMTSADTDFIFIRLSPYLDHLMVFLKRLNSIEMQMVFVKYSGVMKIGNTTSKLSS